MNTEFCVKFYKQVSNSSEPKLYDKVEPFDSEAEARMYALSYLRNSPDKGSISFWRIDPVGS